MNARIDRERIDIENSVEEFSSMENVNRNQNLNDMRTFVFRCFENVDNILESFSKQKKWIIHIVDVFSSSLRAQQSIAMRSGERNLSDLQRTALVAGSE